MAKNDSFRIDKISIDKLHLDHANNPRLPLKVAGASDAEILDYMVMDANVLELMASIGEKGFFYGEPLLVVKQPKDKGYVVVEGNRRLSAVMLLNNPTLCKVKQKALLAVAKAAKFKPHDLPVIIYNSRDEILNYLGYRHITGIKEWDSLAKAKYLHQLFEKSKELDDDSKCRELARIIGSRSDYVKKLLCGLSIYGSIKEDGYYGIKGLEDSISFSLITTALGYNKLIEFLGLESSEELFPKTINKPHLKELTMWMFSKEGGKTRLGESRNLGWLADVVGNDVALKEFRDGTSLEVAFYFSEGAKESVLKAIGEAYKYLDLAYKYAKEVTLDPEDQKQLDRVIKTAQAIKKQTSHD